HGRKAKRIFKYGLEEIATCLLNRCLKAKFDIFQFLSCT
ncbi:MAG: IS4 family transposase, partial [Cytophagaceae bacterium]|nr:IS4 family transposase [Cytophagaceae bacterium]